MPQEGKVLMSKRHLNSFKENANTDDVILSYGVPLGPSIET